MERALLLQELAERTEEISDERAEHTGQSRRRKCRRGRYRRRLGDSVQDRRATIIPSAIEPFQGAATGVGGIIRDIFTMGARPEFLPEFAAIRTDHAELRKSELPQEAEIRNRPPIGGCSQASSPGSRITEIASAFRRSAAKSISTKASKAIRWSMFFASACCVTSNSRAAPQAASAIRFFMSARRRAATVWPGAAFASRELTEESREDRPAVQVGDPFKEKLLLEACLELLATRCRRRHPGHGRGGADLLDM